MGHSRKQIDPFIRAIKKIFPYNAGYFHDRMQLRDELSEGEKEKEPVNADSHLTFIAAGLKNCVTYIHRPEQPVYFIELDGIYKHYVRNRHTAVMAYNRAEIVHRGRLEIPVGGSHAIDAFNLKDPRYGLFATLADWLRQSGVDKGCIDIRLAPEEKHVGMTVNEYETLLMRNDLPQALSDPLRYVLQRGKRLLQHPASIPGKMHAYAAYDSLRFYNELLDQVPVGRSVIDRIFSVLSTPAQRILRLKRHIRLLVSDSAGAGADCILQGTYQSPILVQHQPAAGGVRALDVTLRRFV